MAVAKLPATINDAVTPSKIKRGRCLGPLQVSSVFSTANDWFAVRIEWLKPQAIAAQIAPIKMLPPSQEKESPKWPIFEIA